MIHTNTLFFHCRFVCSDHCFRVFAEIKKPLSDMPFSDVFLMLCHYFVFSFQTALCKLEKMVATISDTHVLSFSLSSGNLWKSGWSIASSEVVPLSCACYLCGSVGVDVKSLINCNVCCETFQVFCLAPDDRPCFQETTASGGTGGGCGEDCADTADEGLPTSLVRPEADQVR